MFCATLERRTLRRTIIEKKKVGIWILFWVVAIGILGLWNTKYAMGAILSIAQSPVSIGYWLGIGVSLPFAIACASGGGAIFIVVKFLSTELALEYAGRFLASRGLRPQSTKSQSTFRPTRTVRKWRRIARKVLKELARDFPYLAMPFFGASSVVAGVIVSRTAKLDPTLTLILLVFGNTLKLLFYGIAGASIWHYLTGVWYSRS